MLRSISSDDTAGLGPADGSAAVHPDRFEDRHVGPNASEVQAMLAAMGLKSLDELIGQTIPSDLRTHRPLQLPDAKTEHEVLSHLRALASKNQVFRSYLGLGYSDCITPPVLQRNVLENPGWYTQYTPYQAEISQGRLECLLNFQTMVTDLTGLPIANASLLDEGTAAAEAMALCAGRAGAESKTVFLVSEHCHPQTIDVVRTRAWPLGLEVVVADHRTFAAHDRVCGILLPYPGTGGQIWDYQVLVEAAHAAGALVVAVTDLLALTLLKPPGEWGADIAIGSAQRFGVPLGYGGPHAAFFATRDALKRQIPGRLIGVSRDSSGKKAYRLSLQTREQHIRREKATSNICTAQALLANMAALYAVYHGPHGLRRIALHVRRLCLALAHGLQRLGFTIAPEPFFDTVTVFLGRRPAEVICENAREHGINLRATSEHSIVVALDETTRTTDIDELLQLFNNHVPVEFRAEELLPPSAEFPEPFRRTSAYLTHPVFQSYHSETDMMRYLKRLESRDLSLTHSMIPLGSCTMKLNAAVEMAPISWPEFARLHPFAPAAQAEGYHVLFRQLEHWLGEITGFAAVSLQPNAGSQGEYAGLLAIQKYHQRRNEPGRTVCLIPQSAHGTNPASAVMAGLTVVPIACDNEGNVELADLKAKAAAHGAAVSCLMITYPSTHGVFEENIREMCAVVHRVGGLVYMDGANMNAQVGLCRPAELGADVCHLNLHKTFCIPHGGGGPGMGPICVTPHLAPFLPGHAVIPQEGRHQLGAVSAAPWGSASILPISYAYIALMGGPGLTRATEVAILNANYIAHRLAPYYPILFRGKQGRVAHECILDLRQWKSVTVEDVAKRLIDYGFHAPTISWPVGGTMMVEPTESESKPELDRFCDALIAIHGEIVAIESGQTDPLNNLLKHAPHTAEVLLADSWNRPYTRQQAAYPGPWTREFKFWPPVGRIDNVFGDRHLVCTCPSMETYADPATAPRPTR